MASADPDLAAAGKDFIRGGWIVAMLGFLGAVARMALSNKKHPAMAWILKGIAGAITGIICYFALHGSNIDPLYKSIIYSCSGAFSSEALSRLKMLLPAKTKRTRQ
jgi:hypothetical protein